MKKTYIEPEICYWQTVQEQAIMVGSNLDHADSKQQPIFEDDDWDDVADESDVQWAIDWEDK